MFKVGDRVELKEITEVANTNLRIGDTGTVRWCSKTDHDHIGVEMDRKFTHSHSLGAHGEGTCEPGHGWYYFEATKEFRALGPDYPARTLALLRKAVAS